jgi:hypothetical protein
VISTRSQLFQHKQPPQPTHPTHPTHLIDALQQKQTMKKINLIILLPIFVAISGCQTAPPLAPLPAAAMITAQPLASGLLNCSPPPTNANDTKNISCEASAVGVHGSEIIVANDKPFQATSFMRFALPGQSDWGELSSQLPSYLNYETFSNVIKAESMSRTPDDKWILVSTAYDRYDPASPRFDPYSVLLAWPVGQPEAARVVQPSTRNGVTSSVEIRHRIERQLGVPYFKIEGLAILPGNRLVFGVRESGESYKKFNYRIALLGTHYSIDNQGAWTLGETFETLLDFVPEDTNLPQGIGLSSIEYNPTLRRLFMLTSTEVNGSLGAYLWSISLDELDKQPLEARRPSMVRSPDGRPFQLNNKSEGMDFIDPHTLLIVSDNDRVTGGARNRQIHQSPYDVLRIEVK